MQEVLRTNLYNEVLNLLELWVHQVLHRRGIYPDHHFAEQTAFQTSVRVAKTSLLSRYVSDFMRDLEANDLNRVRAYFWSEVESNSQCCMPLPASHWRFTSSRLNPSRLNFPEKRRDGPFKSLT